jgi:multidrug efflux pump subunit AcrA (membrane-fusion protein)
MPQCFWQLCTCPDTQPCPEHKGLECSILNGRLITKPEDVNDALTAEAELSLVAMDADDTRLRQLTTQLETRKRDLEREKQDIERMLRNASGYSERKAAVARAKDLDARLSNLDSELRAILDELDVLERRWKWAVNRVSSRLILPYADPNGYCACYTRKVNRLSAVASMFAREQAIIAAVTAEMNAIRVQLQIGFLQFTNLKLANTLAASLTILMFLLTGSLLTAILTLLVGLAAISIGLFILMLHKMTLTARSLAAQRRLLKLFLLYYRLQQIPTCRPPQPEDLEWLLFWQWLFEEFGDDEPPPGPSPPPPGE